MLNSHLFSNPILTFSQGYSLRFFSKIRCFTQLAVTRVRKGNFKRKVAQSELFQMACLIHDLFSSPILTLPQGYRRGFSQGLGVLLGYQYLSQKESVAQSELFQIVSLTHNLTYRVSLHSTCCVLERRAHTLAVPLPWTLRTLCMHSIVRQGSSCGEASPSTSS